MRLARLGTLVACDGGRTNRTTRDKLQHALEMRAVTLHVRAQRLHVLARNFEAFRRRRDPYKLAAGLEHLVAAGSHIAADGVEHHVADRADRYEIFLFVVDRLVVSEAPHIIKITR